LVKKPPTLSVITLTRAVRAVVVEADPDRAAGLGVNRG
jgi:hypothetical protein